MTRTSTSKILVVEDEGITALDIQARLKSLGYTVSAAVSSGEEAIASVQTLRPDLVLMDIVLKGPLDGVQAAGKIRSLFNIPVVYLTAFSDADTLKRAKITEPFGFVLKPFEERDLQTTIEMALYKHMMEEKLRESEREKTLILDSTADVIFFHDTDLRIRWANRAAGMAMRENPENLKGQYCFEIWQFKNAPCEGCPVVMARDTGQAQAGELLSRDGQSWFIRAYPIKDDAGKVTAIAEFSVDISERKRAEEQLRKLSHAVEQSPTSIMITDKEGNIEYVNARFTQVTGYTLDEVKGKNPRLLKSGRMLTEEYQKLWESIASGGEWRGEMQNRKKNGELFWEFASISPIVGVDGSITHFLAVKEDITRRKHLERQILQAQKMESIGTMVGAISHDFNNILNNVLGFVYQTRKYSKDESKVLRYTDMIEKSAARGAELAGQLSSLASHRRHEQGPVDICTLTDEVASLVRETFPKVIAFSAARDKVPVTVVGNHSELYQALFNLCLNAREAMPDGGSLDLQGGLCSVGEEINAAVVPSAILPGQQCACLRIRDTGVGIAESERSRIFDPFFTTKNKGRGAGLGLSVVYNVVKSHKGTILVESGEGSGSVFTIYLPIVQALTLEGDDAGEFTSTARPGILLVDDEPAMIELGRGLLESEGYNVLTASDGRQAVDIYRTQWQHIDLAVLDLVMPKLDGGQTYLEMKKINPDVKAFFCTGYSTDQVITSLLAEENLLALQKPFRPKEFTKLVKDLLRRG